MTYSITPSKDAQGPLLELAFGQPADNTSIVREIDNTLEQLKTTGQLSGGPLLRVTGPASVPAAFVLAHHLVHLYETVAVFDPKLSAYVVVSSHGSKYQTGDLIPPTSSD